ncbi:hypothetical protein FACS189468_8190 [Spirochaetia bacterium]|nr:hypothetical protein FACS189468_8190 [Spirochaetia bacterium]
MYPLISVIIPCRNGVNYLAEAVASIRRQNITIFVILCIPFMQTIKLLGNTLEALADREHYLFSVSDFYSLFPEMSSATLRVLLSRAVKSGILARICHGL